MRKLSYTQQEITVDTDDSIVSKLLAPYPWASISNGFHGNQDKETFFINKRVFFTDFEFEDLERQTNLKFCFVAVSFPGTIISPAYVYVGVSHANLLHGDISEKMAESLFNDTEHCDFLSTKAKSSTEDKNGFAFMDTHDPNETPVSDLLDKYVRIAISNLHKHTESLPLPLQWPIRAQRGQRLEIPTDKVLEYCFIEK